MKQANANGHGTSSLALIDGEDDGMKQANANGHGTESAKASSAKVGEDAASVDRSGPVDCDGPEKC